MLLVLRSTGETTRIAPMEFRLASRAGSARRSRLQQAAHRSLALQGTGHAVGLILRPATTMHWKADGLCRVIKDVVECHESKFASSDVSARSINTPACFGG